MLLAITVESAWAKNNLIVYHCPSELGSLSIWGFTPSGVFPFFESTIHPRNWPSKLIRSSVTVSARHLHPSRGPAPHDRPRRALREQLRGRAGGPERRAPRGARLRRPPKERIEKNDCIMNQLVSFGNFREVSQNLASNSANFQLFYFLENHWTFTKRYCWFPSADLK